MGIYTRTQEASKTQSLAAVESRSLTCKIKYPYSSVALAPFSSTFTPAGYWVLRTAGSSSKQMRAASRRGCGWLSSNHEQRANRTRARTFACF